MEEKSFSVDDQVDAMWSGDGEIYPGVITKELPKKIGESRRFHVAFDDGDEGLVYSPDLDVTARAGENQQVIVEGAQANECSRPCANTALSSSPTPSHANAPPTLYFVFLRRRNRSPPTSVSMAAEVEQSRKHLPLMMMKCLATSIRATTKL